ncbi:Intracellular sulfur oxidation protein DsrF [invertebrate metagenome]|uniref:Intracellular sulfur oxidation protein DsrF n=1 Tax=invertebrate metagenome TaxID=1711999 RepID=A0A2H9T6N0_9ZZZZ
MDTSVCIISTKSPYRGQLAKEAVDATFVSASYGLTTDLLLMGDGIYQLLDQQHPENLPRKSLLSMLKSLPIYGIESVYVDEDSLKARHICAEELALPVKLLTAKQLPSFINQHNKTLTF